MRRAIPAALLSATGFLWVWQFEPPVPGWTVEVKVVFAGSRITDVVVLRAPDTGPTQQALPLLREMALKAQSAHIDTVSGATMTSEAYRKSLQAAIDARGE